MNSLLIAAITASMLLTGQAASGQEAIRLEAASDQGTFRVEILWTSNEIGRENTFAIRFIEPETGTEIEDVKYDILVFKDDSPTPEIRRLDQTATEQKFTFGQPGQYTIRIDDIEDLGESVSIPIEVTPEFPYAAIVLALAAALGAAMFASRSGNNLFRQGIR